MDWVSRMEKLSQSTMEAKLVAATCAVDNINWLHDLLQDALLKLRLHPTVHYTMHKL